MAHDFNNMLTAITSAADFLRESLPAGTLERESADEILMVSNRAAALTRQLAAFGSRQVLRPKTLSMNACVAGTLEMLRRLVGAHIRLRGAERSRSRRARST